MPDFTNTLIVGISSRTLFDLEEEDKLFKEKGITEYRKVQREKEDEELKPGTAYHLVQALLNLNKLSETNRLVEVIVMSSNSPETGVRILNSIKSLKLDITRSAFTGGEKIASYIEAFQVDLFLSKNETDVQEIKPDEKNKSDVQHIQKMVIKMAITKNTRRTRKTLKTSPAVMDTTTRRQTYSYRKSIK